MNLDKLKSLLAKIEKNTDQSLQGRCQYFEDKAEFYHQINGVGPELLAVVEAAEVFNNALTTDLIDPVQQLYQACLRNELIRFNKKLEQV